LSNNPHSNAFLHAVPSESGAAHDDGVTGSWIESGVDAATDELRMDSTHALVRDAILRGDLDVDTPISQVQLAKRLGVSRTPLREALRMLQREGLVRSEPNRRMRVTRLSVGELDELYAQRVVLEALAVQLSVPRFVTADLDELKTLVARMEEIGRARHFDQWEEPHRAYHELLRKYAGARLYELAGVLSDHSERYRRVYMAEPRAWGFVTSEHRMIFEACLERDARTAGRRLARHLARTALAVVASIAPEHDPVAVRTALQLVLAGETPPSSDSI
jgi:DNA-binding GntR family transcriptional regulator